jgi:hypothetical protein
VPRNLSGATRFVIRKVAEFAVGVAVWTWTQRRPRPPGATGGIKVAPKVAAPTSSRSAPTNPLPVSRSGHRRALILPVILTAIGVATLLVSLALQPPQLDVGGTEGSGGEVDVYVSDPTVDVSLEVQVFDWSDWTRFDPSPGSPQAGGHAWRMILFLHGVKTHPIHWAVVLSGGARYREPLPLPASPTPSAGVPPDPEDAFLGGSMQQVGDVQIIQGEAMVGPGAVTERPADWDGEAVGPFVYRSGQYPNFGSQALIRLPAIRGGAEADQWFGPSATMYPPKNFNPDVFFGSSSMPEFIRVDYANPPLKGTDLQWSGDELFTGPTALLTDIPLAEQENWQSQASLATLGIAGGAFIGAIAAWIAYFVRQVARPARDRRRVDQ